MNTPRWTPTALAALIAAAWLLVLSGPTGMGGGLAIFLAAWTVMMIAMMLPSAAPLVLLYRRGASRRATALLAGGYIAIWAAVGVPAWLATRLWPMSASPVILAVAGLYQLTPAKQSCLRHCRSPADFLMQHWGHGALRLGLEHGIWCLGCCWALMAVLVLVGMMGIAWVVGLAALVAIEKRTRHGAMIARVTGVAMLVAAAIQTFNGTMGGI